MIYLNYLNKDRIYMNKIFFSIQTVDKIKTFYFLKSMIDLLVQLVELVAPFM